MQALNFSQVQTLAFAGGGNRCWWPAGLLTRRYPNKLARFQAQRALADGLIQLSV